MRGHTKLTYAQVYDALPVTDADPARPGYLVDFYSGDSILASNRCSSSCANGAWNREHTWPQSHGDFGTSAGIGTDMFHMRPEYGSTNSSRGNKDFDDGGSAGVPLCADCRSTGSTFAPRAAVKGDLARGLLYMAVRYEGDGGELDLKMNDRTCNSSGPPNMGKLSTLVAWSLADPPDDRERARNDLVDADFQHNRNPFIDHPEWVTSIFGNGVGAGPSCGSTSGTEYVPGGTTPPPPANTAPTTSPMTATTAQDTATTVALTATDADGDPLTWSISTAPTRGTATVSGATLTYTPTAGLTGDDVVGVTVSDGRGGTASTTVTVTVTKAAPPAPQPPTAADVAASTAEDSPVTVTLRGSSPTGAALTYAVADAPGHGDVTLDGDRATYVPDGDFHGADGFAYTVTDGTTTSAPATVAITVSPVNDPPVAAPVELATTAGTPVATTLVVVDPDGDPVRIQSVTEPASGSVTRSASDPLRLTYTPGVRSGSDVFTVTVTDGTASVEVPATVTTTARTATLTTSTPRAVRGTRVATTITVAGQDGDPVPTGTVTLRAGGRSVGTATLTAGSATVSWTPTTAGATALSASYAGDRLFAPVTADPTTISTARTTPRLGFTSGTLVRGRAGTLKVSVRTVAGTAATGTVTLTVSGKRLTARLSRGVATFRVAKLPQVSRLRVAARYAGDGQYAAGSATHTYAVRSR